MVALLKELIARWQLPNVSARMKPNAIISLGEAFKFLNQFAGNPRSYLESKSAEFGRQLFAPALRFFTLCLGFSGSRCDSEVPSFTREL
jgi:hypothetical protein